MIEWNELFEAMKSLSVNQHSSRTDECPSIDIMYDLFVADEEWPSPFPDRDHVMSCEYCLSIYKLMSRAFTDQEEPLTPEERKTVQYLERKFRSAREAEKSRKPRF